MAHEPLTFYRLWCGRKRYSAWTSDKQQLWRQALRLGLAYGHKEGPAGLGPLTWFEVGERDRPRSRTRTISRDERWTVADPNGRTIPRRSEP